MQVIQNFIMDDQSSNMLSELYTEPNVHCEFFGNFIDNSHIQHTQSQISNHSVLQQFSVNDEKIKAFHTQNLIHLEILITKRNTIQKWILNKDLLIKQAKKSPQNLTKVLLKVFYTIGFKLQVKYSQFFRTVQRNYKNSVKNLTSKQPENHIEDNRKQIRKQQHQQNKDHNTSIQFFKKCLEKLDKKYNCDLLKSQGLNAIKCKGKIGKIFTALKNLIQRNTKEMIQIGWREIEGRINFIDKVQILCGTLNLLVHPFMREAFWQIRIIKLSLLDSDISNIQELVSLKQESKLNNSCSSLQIPHQLAQNKDFQGMKNSQDNQTQPQKSVNSNFFRKKIIIEDEIIQKSNPKHLKFSKNVKKKNLKSQENSQNFEQQPQQTQRQIVHYDSIPNERQTMKSQIQDFSILRRASVTKNTSVCLSRISVKKIAFPIVIESSKSYKIQTICCQNDLPIKLNEGVLNKSFQNSSNVSKVRPLRHQELRKEFTDLNDLFSVRQIYGFFQALQQQLTVRPKKSISLAKLKEKVNLKTQQQYYQNSKLQYMKSPLKSDKAIISERSIGNSIRTSRKVMIGNTTFFSIKSNEGKQRKSNLSSKIHSVTKQRKLEFKIPTQVPKNFDYYCDKSPLKRQMDVGSKPIQFRQKQGKKKKQQSRLSNSKSSKKLFNVVKSGSSSYHDKYKEK